MSRRFATSTILVIGLLAVAAAQQPISPPIPAKQTGKEKKADPTDAAVAAALANDTDVKIAQAKVQLAEAELAKAKQAVVLKVMTLLANIKEQKAVVDLSRDRYAWSERMFQKGVGDQRQVIEERTKLESAQATLARLETELKLLTGDERGTVRGALKALSDQGQYDRVVLDALQYLNQTQPELNAYDRLLQGQMRDSLLASLLDRQWVKGPIPDRIRAALDKPVKLGARGEKVTFEKALEVFKTKAGLDVPVRGTLPLKRVYDPKNPDEMKSGPIEVVSEGEEMPVGAWFQLFEDNAVFPHPPAPPTRFRFYVREYGLLVSSSDVAPPDAPTLTDFWKQKPPAKTKKDTAPEPKAK